MLELQMVRQKIKKIKQKLQKTQAFANFVCLKEAFLINIYSCTS